MNETEGRDPYVDGPVPWIAPELGREPARVRRPLVTAAGVLIMAEGVIALLAAGSLLIVMVLSSRSCDSDGACDPVPGVVLAVGGIAFLIVGVVGTLLARLGIRVYEHDEQACQTATVISFILAVSLFLAAEANPWFNMSPYPAAAPAGLAGVLLLVSKQGEDEEDD